MEELLAGLVPGLPGRAPRPDPRPRRGRPALRGRDGADAARPRPARPGGLRLPADGTGRGARGAGDAARADRGPARRALRGGAAAAPGRGRARQDVHERRAGRARGLPRPSSSRCSPRSCARRCSACRPTPARPSTASTASSRTSCATSPTRRSRSGSVGPGTSPRPSHLSAAFAADEDEVVEVIASHYLAAYEAAPDAEDAAEIKRQGAGDARAGRRARRVARRGRGGQALLRAGGGAHGGSVGAGGAARPGGRDGREGRRSGLGAPAVRRVDRAARGSKATRMPPPASSGGSGGSTRSHGASRRGNGTDGARVRRHLGRRARRGSRAAGGGALRSATGTAATSSVRPSGPSWRSTSPRRMRTRRPLAVALRAKSARRPEPGTRRGVRGAPQARPSRSRSSTTSSTTRAAATSSSPTSASAATSTPTRSDTSTRPSPSHGSSGTGRRSGPCWPSGRTRCTCSAAGTRRRRTSAEFTQEQIDAGGIVLSLLQSAVEIHIQRGELDGARRIFSMFSRLEESTDVQERSCYLGSRACAAPGGRPARRKRSPTARRPSRWAARFGISAPGASSRASSRRSRRRSHWASRRRSRSCSPRRERSGRLAAAVPRRPGEALPRPPRQGTRPGYEAAAEQFRELGIPFWLAVTLLEHGELTGDESLLAEAREIFERLGARPWLDRVDAAVGSQRQQVPA